MELQLIRLLSLLSVALAMAPALAHVHAASAALNMLALISLIASVLSPSLTLSV